MNLHVRRTFPIPASNTRGLIELEQSGDLAKGLLSLTKYIPPPTAVYVCLCMWFYNVHPCEHKFHNKFRMEHRIMKEDQRKYPGLIMSGFIEGFIYYRRLIEFRFSSPSLTQIKTSRQLKWTDNPSSIWNVDGLIFINFVSRISQ